MAKGLVKRDVIRVITPGTIIEGDMLEDARNNYIASFSVKERPLRLVLRIFPPVTVF